MSLLSPDEPTLFGVDPSLLFTGFIALFLASMIFYVPGGDIPFTCSEEDTYYFHSSRCVNHPAVEQAVVAELQTSDGKMIRDRLTAKTGISYLDVRLTEDWSDRYYCWRGEDANYCELREEGDTE